MLYCKTRPALDFSRLIKVMVKESNIPCCKKNIKIYKKVVLLRPLSLSLSHLTYVFFCRHLLVLQYNLLVGRPVLVL